MGLQLHKYDFYLIIIIFSVSCDARSTFDLESESLAEWLSIFKLSNQQHTVIMNIEGENSVYFRDNFIKSIHRDQSVLLLAGKQLPKPFSKERIRKLVRRKPNIVFSTTSLNSSMLNIPLLRYIFKPNWSLVFIALSTKESMYKCENGKLSREANNNIEVFMNDLWYKYRIMFVIIALPYVCPNEFVIYRGRKPSNGNLYNRSIELISPEEFSKLNPVKGEKMLARNYPLRASIFRRFPTAINNNCSATEMYVKTSDNSSGGFCGIDGFVMADIVRHFQFNLSIPKLDPGYDSFGYQDDSGVITGSLGHTVRGDVDISFNSRFMVAYVRGDRNFHLLYYVSQDALCALMKLPNEEPLWLYPCDAFTLPQWLLILTALTTTGVFMWIVAKGENKIHKRKVSSLFSYIKNSVNAGFFGFFLVRRNDLLLLRGCCLYVSIMILATYQSYINYMFTTRWYHPINTLPELWDSGTMILTSSSVYSLIEIPSNDIQAALQEKIKVLDDTNFFKYVSMHSNTAALERKSDAILVTLMTYTNEDGRPMLYVVNECFRVFYLSYITNIKFPFSRMIQLFMMRLVESGLPEMYYKWTSRSLGLDVSLPSLVSDPRPAAKITLGEEIIPFGVLLIGYFVSTCVLIIEIWMARRTRLYPYLP